MKKVIFICLTLLAMNTGKVKAQGCCCPNGATVTIGGTTSSLNAPCANTAVSTCCNGGAVKTPVTICVNTPDGCSFPSVFTIWKYNSTLSTWSVYQTITVTAAMLVSNCYSFCLIGEGKFDFDWTFDDPPGAGCTPCTKFVHRGTCNNLSDYMFYITGYNPVPPATCDPSPCD